MTDNPRERIRHAIELLHRAEQQATPAPWRDSVVDGNRYGALVSDTMHPQRAYGRGWDYDPGYGGCLVGESHMPEDRRLIATMRNTVGPMLNLLGALVDENPLEAAKWADSVATQIILTHTPRKPL